MVQLRESSPSPESNKFNPADFPSGTDILFFDDSSKKWTLGTVNTWKDPVKDSDGKLNGNFSTSSGIDNLKLSLLPKKIDKIPKIDDRLDINGKKYRVDLSKTNVIQDTFEVELTLVNADPTKSNDRLENINLKTIKNLESVEKFETDIETKVQKLKADVLAKADARTKDILKDLTKLQTRIVAVAEQLGALSEWQDIGQAEAEQIGQSIKELQTEINTELAVLENKLKNIEKRKDGKDSSADEADGLQTRLDRETKNKTKKNIEDHKTAVDNAKTVHDSWKKDKAEWDKKKKAKEDWDKLADKKGKPDPGDPGTEPTEPPKPESIKSPEVDQAKIDAAFDLFTALETSTATLPATDKFKQIIKKVKDLADIEAKREGFGDFTRYDNDTKKEVIAKIFQEVLNKEKGNVAVEGEKFDLNKEKEDLKTKIKEIMARAEVAGVAMPVGKTIEQVTNEWLADITSIVPGAPPRTQADQEKDILNQWDLIRTQELKVFEAEHKKAPKTERVESEKDIAIPDSLLMELLMTKQAEVQAAMKELYSGSLNLGSENNKNVKMLDAVKDIFGSQTPDQAMRNKLAEHGIRNWNTFKKSWDKKLHIQVAAVLNEWAKGQLKNRAQGGVYNFLKNNGGGALVNMGVSLGFTYGGAQLGGLLAERFSGNVADAANKAAIGVASKIGGGTLAGVAKAGFHKLTGGIFARKQEAKAQSAEEKAIEALVRATGMADFSSILAQSLRDISSEAVGGDVKDFAFDEAKKLKGDARRTYINHLKKMRAEGKEITDKIRLSLAISCEELMGNLEIKQEQFATPEHMGIITTIEEGQKYLGYKKGVVAGALVGGSVTAGFLAAGAYVPVLSSVLGTASGMSMGYRMADKLHEGSKMKSGKKNFTALFEQTNSVFAKYKLNEDAKEDAIKKTFSKDIAERKSSDVLMENIQRINRLLKGKADSESDLEMMQYLNSDPNLLARAKNLLYESHRSNLFAEHTIRKMQEQAEKIRQEAKVEEYSKNKKQAVRALGAFVGGVAGGWLAMSIGVAVGQHRLDSQTQHDIKVNAEHFDKVIKPQIVADAKIPVVTAASIAAEHAASVPTAAEVVPPAPAAEVAPHHPAGLIEAPTGVKTFHAWEQKMFKNMGYTKLPNGNIQHTFRYHADQPDIAHKGEIIPGTKFVLTKPDGTPISVKGHVVEYKFKHGDSYSSAMDHMKHDIKIAIAAGETPTIKMEGHIDVGDGKGNFIIEHHSGGHTHMESGEAVPEAKGKQLNWSDVKVKGVHDVPKGNFDLSTVKAGDSGVFTAADGLEYQQQPGGATADYYVRNNHLYTFEGKYIGEQYLQTESHAGKTSWSSGGAIADKPALEAMLKGTTPGGAVEVATPQSGTPKGGGTVEVGKPATAGIVADKVAAPAPAAEAKSGAPATATPEAAPAGMPKAWEGHVAEYKGLQGMKLNIEAAIKSGKALEVDVSHDKLKVLSGLMNDIEKSLAKSPNLLNQKALHDALDPNSTVPLDARLLKLVAVLDNTKNITLSSEERLLLGDTFIDDDKFFHTDIVRNGKTVEAWVDKKGSNAVVYVDKDTDHRELVTDPKVKFDPDNLGNAKKRTHR